MNTTYIATVDSSRTKRLKLSKKVYSFNSESNSNHCKQMIYTEIEHGVKLAPMVHGLIDIYLFSINRMSYTQYHSWEKSNKIPSVYWANDWWRSDGLGAGGWRLEILV